ISIIDPTCEADGYAQIEGYDSELTYTFNSEDVSVDADGVITGPAGDYTVTVTNAEGCASDSASFTIEGMLPTPKITVKATSDPTTCSGEDGSIGLTFTGIEDGSYEMSYGGGSFGTVTITDGEATITGLSAGSYMNIRVTNTDDCTSDENVNVTLEDPEAPEAPGITVTDPTCDAAGFATIDEYDGSLTYIVSGAAQIDEEGKITGPAGTYTVTVEDHGCSAVSIEFTLAEQLPTPETPKISIIDPTCEADGYAQIEGYDSELTYTFNSEDVSVDADGVITGPAGDYTVTVTNAEGCASDSASFTIEGMRSEE